MLLKSPEGGARSQPLPDTRGSPQPEQPLCTLAGRSPWSADQPTGDPGADLWAQAQTQQVGHAGDPAGAGWGDGDESVGVQGTYGNTI